MGVTGTKVSDRVGVVSKLGNEAIENVQIKQKYTKIGEPQYGVGQGQQLAPPVDPQK